MSEEYRRTFNRGLTRNLAAMRSDEASTHSIGLIGEATAFSMMGRGNDADATVDRVLDGPTTEAWLGPWAEHLSPPRRRLPVRLDASKLSTSVAGASSRPRRGTPPGRHGHPGRLVHLRHAGGADGTPCSAKQCWRPPPAWRPSAGCAPIG